MKAPGTSKIRYAVIGLGYIAQASILPAFRNARRNSELVALVSDDPAKLRLLGRKYDVERLFNYQQLADALEVVDAVFIALPNTLHLAYTEAAATAGVHVLCEKPLAMTEEDCRQMIEVCAQAKVKLMVGYRLHFERANLEAASIVARKIGEPRLFTSTFTHDVKPGNLRLRRGEGGPLYDIGIYCLNAARALFKAEPTQVFAYEASRNDPRFKDCAEMVSVQLRFPEERLASFTCSFGAASRSTYEVVGTRGSLRLDPAFSIDDELVHYFTRNEKTRRRAFPRRDQFAPELLYFSDCILNDREPEPSGEEGLMDVRVLEAIGRSIESERPVDLLPATRKQRPTLVQEIRRPAKRRPRKLVNAKEPS